jgi:hypothetical protein
VARFARAEDGNCTVTSRTDPHAHLFEVAPGRIVGLFYVGGPVRSQSWRRACPRSRAVALAERRSRLLRRLYLAPGTAREVARG